MRRSLIAVLALISLAVAGCGGGGSTTATGSAAAEVAGIVPASAPLLIAVETDPDSDQWQKADALLSKFPGKQRLLTELRTGLAGEGIDLDAELLPALGDESYVVFLDLEDEGDNVVVLTKPRDKAKLTELLKETNDPTETREIDGWTAIAGDTATLDRFATGGAKLADADWFGEAQERVEEDSLVTIFANGEPITEALRTSVPDGCNIAADQGTLRYAVGTMTAADDGLRLRFAAEGEGAKAGASGESLLSEVPSGAYAYLGSPAFNTAGVGVGEQLRCALEAGGIPDVEDELGVRYQEILDLFAGGFGVYLRPATLIPEITLLLAPEDAAKSLGVLDTLAENATDSFSGDVQRRTISGTEAREVQLGPVSILYGANGSHIAVTSARGGIEALAEGGPSLADDETFKSATEAAGVGDDEVFAYFDLRKLVDLADGFAGFAEQDLPPEVRENLEPLESFLLWGDASDPNDLSFGAFLKIG